MPTNEQRREAAKRKLERQLVRRAERARKRRIFGVAGTAVGVVVAVGLVYLLTTMGGSDDTPTDPAAQTDTTQPEATPDTPASIPTEMAQMPVRPTALPATAECSYPASEGEPAAKPAQAPAGAGISAQGTVDATVKLNSGEVKLKLDRALAPCTVNSFVSLAQQGYFDGTTCHRLTTEGIQVLQCGDPAGTGMGGPGYSFADEVFPEIKYGRGMLAMANSGPNTNGSQFFIVYGTADVLQPNYTVFGSIEPDSMTVIDDIAKKGTVSQGQPGDGSPAEPVEIETVAVAS